MENEKFLSIALLRFLPRQVGVRNDKEYCMLGFITAKRWDSK